MIKPNLQLVVVFVFLSLFGLQAQNLHKYVNPFIGTGGHGHTYPGASVPFGGVQLSPDTRLTGWDGCSAYHYTDSVIFGFSHTHLSGTGVSDYGDILFAPITGKLVFDKGTPENPDLGYASRFSHEKETAIPGYYSVFLEDYKIQTELTVTERCGFHQYHFPKKEKAHIIIDLKHRDEVLDSYIEVVSDTEIRGYRRSSAWARDQYLYFVAKFSEAFTTSGFNRDGVFLHSEKKKISGKDIKLALSFGKVKNVKVKIGLSAVDEKGALKNLEAEIADWNFKNIKKAAVEKWEKQLAKIKVEGGTKEEMVNFYSAMYHSYLNPNVYMDVDGRYRGTDLKIHQSKDHTQYTVFSLWDTFRATHPLFTLTDVQKTNDFIRTFIKQYEQGGILPMWEFAGNYTYCMIGYHAIPVIVDAYMKGIRDYDIEKAYEAMKYSANLDKLGLDAFKKYGYIPMDLEHESVSKTLEYAYDDWCIAVMAKELGKTEDYKYFMERAQYYKNMYDPETGFMRPKMNGAWLKPFDPKEVTFHFTEANSWQYSFFVPQDIEGHIDLMGGAENYSQLLDKMFAEVSETSGRHQVDITGLIGQYAHGNEPSHHMAYLYNYAGKPWKTQEMLRRIMKEMYTNQPDGLCGNEDCGQMSSWYVFSAMGIYPVTPGNNIYSIGSPLFTKAVVNLENGKQFEILSNASEENMYIQSAKLNGRDLDRAYITHEEIIAGGKLELVLSSKPTKLWMKTSDLLKTSSIQENKIVSVPFANVGQRTFFDSLEISLHALSDQSEIYYQLNDSDNWKKYEKPFFIQKTTQLKAFAEEQGVKSKVMEAKYHKRHKLRTIEIVNPYSRQYTAGGDFGMIDGIRGADNFKNGCWQGYQNKNFEAIVNLGKEEEVSKVGAGFLQEIRSWIWMPTHVEVFLSMDGKNFDKVAEIKNIHKDNDYEISTRDFVQEIAPQKARFVKVIAYNYGEIPEWHLGAGGQAFIFVDEVIVE